MFSVEIVLLHTPLRWDQSSSPIAKPIIKPTPLIWALQNLTALTSKTTLIDCETPEKFCFYLLQLVKIQTWYGILVNTAVPNEA